MSKSFAAFMSYVRLDDQHENGRLTDLRSRLSGEVRIQSGEEFSIFQDKNDISWGQQWKTRIEDAIDGTTFLIPIITPSFFKSPPCREEVERFLKREKELGRSDLIFPVYYVSCPLMNAERHDDPIAQTFASRQYADWRELRFEPLTTPAAGKSLATFAEQIVRALEHVRQPRPQVAIAMSAKDAGAQGSDGKGERMLEPEPADEAVRPPTGKREPRTLVVDALFRGDYPTLSEALTAAQPGYRILVRPGLYREGVVIDKAVEIIGDGELGDVVIEATGTNVLLFQANMGRVANLVLRQMPGGKHFAVNIRQGRLDLEGCDISSGSLSCVAIGDGADPRLRRNRIHDSKQSGVFVLKNGFGTLEDNEIFGNALAGVSISGNPILRRNRIYNGSGGGVSVYENGLGTLEDNEIYGNALSGVEIKEGANPILRHNRIHGGRQSGVFVHTKGRGTLEDNEIFANASAGISVKTGGNPTFRRNVVSKNGFEAVWIYDGGRGEFTDNDLSGNARGAFDVAEDCEAGVKRERNKE